MWTRQQAIDYALSQVGQTDGSLYFKIAFGYRSQADWCAAFDSAIKVLGKLDCPYFPNTYAFDKRDLAKIGDRWVEPYDLEVGDFISFDFDGGGQYGGDHVGIVVKKYARGEYQTVEGNCAKAVRSKYRTVKNTRTYNADGSLRGIGIIGGIRPYYEEDEVTDADIQKIAKAVWAYQIDYKNGADDKPHKASAAARLGYIDYETHPIIRKLDQIIGILAGR